MIKSYFHYKNICCQPSYLNAFLSQCIIKSHGSNPNYRPRKSYFKPKWLTIEITFINDMYEFVQNQLKTANALHTIVVMASKHSWHTWNILPRMHSENTLEVIKTKISSINHII